jgi:hypothetical protein
VLVVVVVFVLVIVLVFVVVFALMVVDVNESRRRSSLPFALSSDAIDLF